MEEIGNIFQPFSNNRTPQDMTEFPRSFFMKDPEVLGKLHKMIVENHKVANHTEKTLIENRHIKDFCEEARHFIVLDGKPQMYLHYDCASWFKEPMGVQVTIDSIGVYDDFMEYEKARTHQLYRAEKKDIPNIN